MQIKVKTDSNIEGREKLTAHVRRAVMNALNRFDGRITHVEVHLSDQNGAASGQSDKCCMMEAHIMGRQPTAVMYDAASLDLAVDGAVNRIQRSIESALGWTAT